MRQWNGDQANDARNEQAYAMQYHASTIEKLLETEDLREFDEDTIKRLAEELHEMIVDICNEPTEMSQFISPKEAVLADLRNASNQLNLAWNQADKNGKSVRFYHYLRRCREYLEKVFEANTARTHIQKNTTGRHSPTTLSNPGTISFSLEMMLTRLQAFLHEYEEMQPELEHIYEIFCFQDRFWASQCNEAIASLSTFCEVLHSLRELLFGPIQLPPGIPSPGYDLMVKLFNMEEQARTLISQITSIRAICQTKSKQAMRLAEAIRIKLEVLLQSDKYIWLIMTHHIRDLQLHTTRTGRRFRLVHSRDNADENNIVTPI
jgi:hypothetical protein